MIRVLDKYFFAGYDLGIWMRGTKLSLNKIIKVTF
jgi:hypothetical protein